MYEVLLIINEIFVSDVTINRFFEICNKFYLIKNSLNLLLKMILNESQLFGF